MKMNSKKLTPYHLTQLAVLIILFVIFLLLAAWTYSTYFVAQHTQESKPATKEDIEKIYGTTVEVEESDKTTIEGIYGN